MPVCPLHPRVLGPRLRELELEQQGHGWERFEHLGIDVDRRLELWSHRLELGLLLGRGGLELDFGLRRRRRRRHLFPERAIPMPAVRRLHELRHVRPGSDLRHHRRVQRRASARRRLCGCTLDAAMRGLLGSRGRPRQHGVPTELGRDQPLRRSLDWLHYRLQLTIPDRAARLRSASGCAETRYFRDCLPAADGSVASRHAFRHGADP